MKWINDIHINDRKIAGVLCRCEDDYLSIGVGVNLNVGPEEILEAICLKEVVN